MDVYPLSDDQTLWMVHGHEVDLNQGGTDSAPQYPPNARGRALLARDGHSEDDQDLMALCDWMFTDHPNWDGGCPNCNTSGECPEQRMVIDLLSRWLMRRTNEIWEHAKEVMARV